MKPTLTLTHLLFSALIGLSALLFSFAPTLLLLLPAFLAFIALAWGPWCFGVAIFFSAASAFTVTGFTVFGLAEGLQLLALYIPATFILTYHLQKKRPWRNAINLSAVAMIVGQYIAMCLPSILLGQGPFGDLHATTRLVFDQFLAAAPRLLAFTEAETAALRTQLAFVLTELPSIATSIMVFFALIFGFADTLIARALCRRAQVPLKPMVRFSHWQLSRDALIGGFIMAGGALLCWVFHMRNAEAVVSAIQYLIIMPLALVALSTLAFFNEMNKRCSAHLTYALIAVLAIIASLSPLVFSMLSLLGLIETIFRLRLRYLMQSK
ncbi:MAG: YybS family protein [Christensenellaceae bacterium]|nr:YybS family protein [Christensenellaceae bacterium]